MNRIKKIAKNYAKLLETQFFCLKPEYTEMFFKLSKMLKF